MVYVRVVAFAARLNALVAGGKDQRSWWIIDVLIGEDNPSEVANINTSCEIIIIPFPVALRRRARRRAEHADEAGD